MLTLPRFYYDSLSPSYTGHQHVTPTNEPTKHDDGVLHKLSSTNGMKCPTKDHCGAVIVSSLQLCGY
jgi:hypothetical protein